MAKNISKKTKKKNIQLIEMVFSLVTGIIAIGAGGFGIFTGINDISVLSLIAGNVILALSVIDFISLFRTRCTGGRFAFSLLKAGSELLIAIFMLINNANGMTWPLTLLSVYMIGQGVLQILSALAFIANKTERFFWIICGAIGDILGIIALNSGALADKTSFFRVFSIYLVIYGVTSIVSLVYKAKE